MKRGGKMIKYKIDILEELSKRGYNTGRIRKEKLIGEATLTQIRKGAPVNMKTLNDICIMLRLHPGDVLEVVPTDDEKIRFF